ncbi:conserved hypothetical protein [Vibrio phage 501E54-1]|nr:conserved hypothetical protein [Vibrio phage 501E54-1]
MEDLEKVASLYEGIISEMCYSYREEGFAQTVEEGISIVVDFYADHSGGLEGFYSTEYEGNFYINNECYRFRMLDIFCDEGSFEIYEKYSEEDLQPDDRGYVDLSNVEVSEEVILKENNIMATVNGNGLDLVTVILMDEDKDLEGKQAIVAKFEDIVLESGMTDSDLMLALALEHDVAGALKDHNEKRSEVTSKSMLARHGNEVKLQPVTIRDLKVIVK